MNPASSELLEKIRQQFDFEPYPRTPIDFTPKDNLNLLFVHCLTTPYYLRNRKVIQSEKATILDAGCGTGSKCLALALANPGAKVVGIDLSENSVELARQRLAYHNIENAEFYVAGIENLPQLGLEFDYINCDEVLYLFSDIADGLRAMKAVLKPHGIIRSNLHSRLQREMYFRAQKLFRLMGLMENNPEDLEIEIAIDTLKALKEGVELKRLLSPKCDTESRNEWVLMNLLFQGDKGYTIPDLFAALRSANLEFINMVNWYEWDLLDLFQDADNLPAYWAMSLPGASIEERLHLFELMHSQHRLIDFWCGHPDQTQESIPVGEWETTDWKNAQVYLHPQLKASKVRNDLVDSLKTQAPFTISQHLKATAGKGSDLMLDTTSASLLLPLWEQPQSFPALVEHWLRIKPVDPVTLEPTRTGEAFEQVKQILSLLESNLYVLIEAGNGF